MNRIAVRLSVGLLVAVLLSVIGVQSLLHWQITRAMNDREPGVATELLAKDDPRLSETARADLTRRGHHFERVRPFGGVVLVALPTTGEIVRIALLGSPRPPSLTWPLIAGLVGLVIVAAGTAVLLSRPLVRKLRMLQSVAARIANGDLAARVQITQQDALGEFAYQFNQMADRNQTLLEKQRDLMRAVAHELRTPAARIRFALELLHEATTDQQRERHILAIDSDLSEVDSLVRELLLLDHLESDPDATAGETFPVLRAVDDEIERLQPMRPQIQVVIEHAVAGDERAVGSEKLFRRALRNLLVNAQRHADGHVRVSVARGAREIMVSIDDDGPGIPPADRLGVLEPFTRLDRSRSRGTGGFGLGLTIVSRILRAAGGQLKIGDADLGGASFVMSWPLHEEG